MTIEKQSLLEAAKAALETLDNLIVLQPNELYFTNDYEEPDSNG